MNKRLLLSLAAMLGVVGVHAYNVGDYIYTSTAKFKVVGENTVTNGDFSNNTTGWSDATGTGTCTFSIEQAEGLDGFTTAAQSPDGKVGTGITNVFALTPGTYVYSYRIKGVANTTSSVTAGAENYIDFFVNKDGSVTREKGAREVAETQGITATWTTINDTVNIASEEMLVMHMERLTAGTQITGVEIHKISEVYDTRKAEKVLANAEMLLSDAHKADFDMDAESRTEFKETVAWFKKVLAGQDSETSNEDVTSMTSAVNDLLAGQKAFLDKNSADMSGTIKTWVGTDKRQKHNGQLNDFTFTGGRWFHMNSKADADNEIYSTISALFDMPDASATLTKELPAGQYMATIDLKGFVMAGTAKDQRYTPNYNSDLTGATITLGDKTIDAGVLDEREYTTYTLFAKLKEPTANAFKVNFVLPENYRGKKLGGNFYIANFTLRKLHNDQNMENTKTAVAAIVAQQAALKGMVDSATVVAGKTEQYAWNFAELKDSVAKYKDLYEGTLAVVDAEGNLLDDSKLDRDADDNVLSTSTYAEALKTYVTAMRGVIQGFYNTNKPYVTLVAYVATAKESLNAENHKNATATRREAFVELIGQAEALIASAANADGDAEKQAEFTTTAQKLLAAQNAFETSTASYKNPTSIAIINANFAANGSGWTFSANTPAKEAFRYDDKNIYVKSGKMANVWRGYTVAIHNKQVQEVTLHDAGVYEYRAKAYAANENAGRDNAYATVTVVDETSGVSDTTWDNDLNQARLIFGLSGIEDSVCVHSVGLEPVTNNKLGLTYNNYYPSTYSVFFTKPADGEEKATFGWTSIDANDAAGANLQGFGDNELFYYGDATAYAAAAATALQGEVSKAQGVLSAAPESVPEYVKERLDRAIVRAQAALAAHAKGGSALAKSKATDRLTLMANATWQLQYAQSLVNSVVTGVKGVFTNDAVTTSKKAVKGIYNMAGQKVANTEKNLPAGLYIVNGKKLVIK